MRPLLPKLLLAALLAAQSLPAATEWTRYDQGYTPDEYDEYKLYMLSGDLVLNTTLQWPDADVAGEGDVYTSNIVWDNAEGSSSSTLSGTGKLTGTRLDDMMGYGRMNLQSELYLELPHNAVIEKGITLENMYIESYSGQVTIKGTLKNCMIRAHGDRIDLTQATLEDCDYDFDNDMGGTNTVVRPELALTTESRADIWSDGIIEGNVSISGSLYGNMTISGVYDDLLTPEQNAANAGYSIGQAVQMMRATFNTPLVYWIDGSCYVSDSGAPQIVFHGNSDDETSGDKNYGCLTITGTLTVSNPAPVVFAVELYSDFLGDESVDAKAMHDYVVAQGKSGKWVPNAQLPLIICGKVSEQSVSNLKPFCYFSVCTEYSETAENSTESFSALTNKKFMAEAGEDGQVYIYLRDGEWTNTPTPTPSPTPTPTPTPTPGLVVGSGSTVTLGGADKMPSVSKPVQMQGGTADASGLDAGLLNNKVFKGNGGVVKLGDDQIFSISGSGTVGYGISGGKLSVSDGSNAELTGSSYGVADTTVGAGMVTVSSSTTLGAGDDSTVALTKSGARLTNYGKVNADTSLAGGTRLLNQGQMLGDVALDKGATAINNGSISGKLTVAGGARAYGSGNFADALVESGGFLHVGNSPGYQYHKALELQGGSTISFSVDGTTPATAAANGSGTYSQMKVDSLTLSGMVNVAVDVTMGVLSAGSEPMELTLLTAGTVDGSADFALQLEDAMGLLEEAELSWSGTALTLNASVSAEAIAIYTSQDAVHLANSMWASAAVIQDFARVAESQMIIGTPGQTTWWGSGFGTFMNVSDDAAGYTYHSGGYAVGLQHAFTESFRAGFALGQNFGTYTSEDRLTDIEQMGIMPALTAQYVSMQGKNSFSLNAHIAYGMMENEADTCIGGNAAMPGHAEWDDTVFSGGIRAAWNMQVSDNVTVSPFMGLTYRHVSQDAFSERYNGGQRHYDGGDMQVWSLPVGVTLRSTHALSDGGIVAPELTLAYVADVSRDNPELNARYGSISRRIEGYDPGRSSFMLNAGVNWLIDQNWSLGAYYNLDARADQTIQSFNGSVRYSF